MISRISDRKHVDQSLLTGLLRSLSRGEARTSHPGSDLARDLGQHRLGQELVTPTSRWEKKPPELHELNNVSSATPRLGVIAIQLLHLGKIFIADSDNDDGDGQHGDIPQQGFGLFEICYEAISDDEEDKVVGRILSVSLSKLSDMSDDGTEVSGSIELNTVQSSLISLQDTLEPSAVGTGRIQAQEELMGHLVGGGHLGPETKRRKHFVRVVVLDDGSDSLDGRDILVWSPTWSIVVEGGGIRRMAVGASEVDGHSEVELKAAVDEVQEGITPGRVNLCQRDDARVCIFRAFLLLLLLVDAFVLIIRSWTLE